MKKITFYVFLITLFLFSGLTLTAQTGKKPELLTIETFKQKVWDYKASPKEIKYLGDKPCLIDFYADWCGWCKKIAPFIEELGNAYANEIYVYKINTDQQKELQALFQATGLPTVIFIPMKGQATAVRGAQSKDQYEQYIKQLLLAK